MIKEIRKVSMNDLRDLCISRDWFTCGDNDDYSIFLNYSKKDNLTTEDLEEMANMIIKYSSEESLKHYDKLDVMYCISDISITYFEE